MHQTKPRVPLSLTAQLRLAYILHGWKIKVVSVLLLFVGGTFLITTQITRNASAPTETKPSDEAIFQTEILYAAAHGYAESHQGNLPPADSWQTDLRPYLVRAGAASILSPQPPQKRHFVMNRALANAPLSRAAETPETLLFWQAQTDETDLPSADSQTPGPPFLAVTASGGAVVATPQGKGKPLLLRPTGYFQPSRYAQPYN